MRFLRLHLNLMNISNYGNHGNMTYYSRFGGGGGNEEKVGGKKVLVYLTVPCEYKIMLLIYALLGV